jgi:hypothetical protein
MKVITPSAARKLHLEDFGDLPPGSHIAIPVLGHRWRHAIYLGKPRPDGQRSVIAVPENAASGQLRLTLTVQEFCGNRTHFAVIDYFGDSPEERLLTLIRAEKWQIQGDNPTPLSLRTGRQSSDDEEVVDKLLSDLLPAMQEEPKVRKPWIGPWLALINDSLAQL